MKLTRWARASACPETAPARGVSCSDARHFRFRPFRRRRRRPTPRTWRCSGRRCCRYPAVHPRKLAAWCPRSPGATAAAVCQGREAWAARHRTRQEVAVWRETAAARSWFVGEGGHRLASAAAALVNRTAAVRRCPCLTTHCRCFRRLMLQ